MLHFALMASTAIALPLLLAIMANLLAMRTSITRETATPFECGFDPKNSARKPFSLRFFLLAVIFLIFDVEVALLLPLPLALTENHAPATLFAATSFLLILLWGLAHEWREGSLDWA